MQSTPRGLSDLAPRFILEVTSLSRLWGVATQLLLRPPLRDDDEIFQLTHRAASGFFGVVQYALVRETVLGACRLSDPPLTNGYANLSVPALFARPEVAADPSLRTALQPHAAQLAAERPTLKTLRHKVLAHLDEEFGTDPLADSSVEAFALDRAVTACEHFATALGAHLGLPTPNFQEIATDDPRGVGALLAALRSADPGLGYHWTAEGVRPDPAP